MKILFYKWNAIIENDMQEAMEENQIEVKTFDLPIKDYLNDDSFFRAFEKKLKEKAIDYVFSFNYFPVISDVCQKHSIPYISYVFDSPHLTLFCNNILNKCNFIFVFDSKLCGMLKEHLVENVYYMPLCVNTKRLDKTVKKDEKYMSDISFVGSLYLENNYYDKINYLPEYLKGFFKGIMNAQKKIYGCNFLGEVIEGEVLKELKKYVDFNMGDEYWASDELVFSSLFLSRKLTSMERSHISEMLGKEFDYSIYTGDNTSGLIGVKNKGIVDYSSQMPRVFYNSKINLNITLRSIDNGIPLRAFDIMGSHGFLLSNYQPDFFQHFQADVDYVYYGDTEELKAKADFYLKNDFERERILNNGYNKVKEFHNFHIRLKEILSKVKGI